MQLLGDDPFSAWMGKGCFNDTEHSHDLQYCKCSTIEYLLDITESENIEVEEKIVSDALKLYADKNIDFADALINLKVKENLCLLTWDKGYFKKLDFCV